MAMLNNTIKCYPIPFIIILILSILYFAGCSKKSNDNIDDNNEKTLHFLQISPPQQTLANGTKNTLTATAIYDDDSKEDVTHQVLWSSENIEILTVSNDPVSPGLISSQNQGTTNITAHFNNISATTSATITAATLNQIEISPLNPVLPLSMEMKIQAWGIYSDGSKYNITQEVLWAIQDTSIATNNSNVITPIKAGTTNISVQIDNKIAHTLITVTQAQLSSITITTEVNKIASGQDLALTAIGLFNDNTNQNITSQVTWQSSNTQVIFVSNHPGNIGIIKGLQAGETSITATMSGLTGELVMQVSNAVLKRIDISSPQQDIPTDNQTQLRAVGYYSDETSQDLTQHVTWKSSTPTVIQIDNSLKNSGLARSFNSGQSRIDATYQGITTSIQLNVTSASLAKIEITSANTQIPLGSFIQFFATGIYSNGSTKNITRDVAWYSFNSDILQIQNTDNSTGLAKSKTAGDTIISAALGDITDSISVKVNKAILNGIDIKSLTTTIGKSTNLILTAFANYSDGSVLDISNHASWTSSNQAVLSFLENQNENGKLIAKSRGTSTVSASWNDKTGTSIISVHDIDLETIQIILDSTLIANGTHALVIAIGNYTDGSQQDLTNQVNWQSLDNSILSISASPANNMIVANAHALGSTSLIASLADISMSIDINVTDSILERLVIMPNNPSPTLGETFQLQAIGYFSDDTQQNLTDQVIWSISDTSIATISNADGNQGLLSTLSLGAVDLKVRLSDISTSVILPIIDDPSKPVSISISASPNVIFNDNQDQTQITINLKAANSQSQVIDGTEILLEVIQGEASLSETTLTISQGKTSFMLSSSHEGLVTVKATVKATNISNDISVFSTSQLANVIRKGAFAIGQVINGNLAADTIFGYYIINLSNRPFTLDTSIIANEQRILEIITDAESLNDHQLNPRDMAGIIFVTDTERPNKYAAAFQLTDIATSQPFFIEINLTIDAQ